VVELRTDFSRPYLGNGFVAEYPNGERHLQWEGDSNWRFNEICDTSQQCTVQLTEDTPDAQRAHQAPQSVDPHTGTRRPSGV
jgi:hypothetical protein